MFLSVLLLEGFARRPHDLASTVGEPVLLPEPVGDRSDRCLVGVEFEVHRIRCAELAAPADRGPDLTQDLADLRDLLRAERLLGWDAVGQLWLWPRTATPGEPDGNGGAGFPENFRIEVSDDGTSWTTAATYTGRSSDGSTGQEYDVAASGRYVRVVVERLGRPAPDEAGSGFHRLQLAELEVYAPE